MEGEIKDREIMGLEALIRGLRDFEKTGEEKFAEFEESLKGGLKREDVENWHSYYLNLERLNIELGYEISNGLLGSDTYDDNGELKSDRHNFKGRKTALGRFFREFSALYIRGEQKAFKRRFKELGRELRKRYTELTSDNNTPLSDKANILKNKREGKDGLDELAGSYGIFCDDIIRQEDRQKRILRYERAIKRLREDVEPGLRQLINTYLSGDWLESSRRRSKRALRGIRDSLKALKEEFAGTDFYEGLLLAEHWTEQISSHLSQYREVEGIIAQSRASWNGTRNDIGTLLREKIGTEPPSDWFLERLVEINKGFSCRLAKIKSMLPDSLAVYTRSNGVPLRMRFACDSLSKEEQKLADYWNSKWPKEDVVYAAKNGQPYDVRGFVCPDNVILRAIIDQYKLKGKSHDETAFNCMRFVQQNVKYVDDIITNNAPEDWVSPPDMVAKGVLVGDCEDGTNLMVSLMRNAGMPAYRVKNACGIVESQGHSYALYLREKDNQWVVLDWCYRPNEKPISERPLAKDEPYYGDVFFTFNDQYAWAQHALRFTKDDLNGGMINVRAA